MVKKRMTNKELLVVLNRAGFGELTRGDVRKIKKLYYNQVILVLHDKCRKKSFFIGNESIELRS